MLTASTFPKEYYAVIFSSRLRTDEEPGYEAMAEKMVTLAQDQKGFLGIESARDMDGFGITVSYWESQEDISQWKKNSEHRLAQEYGRSKWYQSFAIRVCKVTRDYDFMRRA